SGTTVTLEVLPYDNVKTLKQNLFERVDIPVDEQRLMFAGKQLATISSYYALREGATLDLVLRLMGGGEIDVTIKTLTGRKIDLKVQPDDLVDKVKAILEKCEKIPSATQVLIYAGKQLEDGKSLSDYNVKPNATIHLVLRLDGGRIAA
ncbi:polyubiquitin, partial [Gonapodya prolifera JEL478]